jgi:hypothetical protein
MTNILVLSTLLVYLYIYEFFYLNLFIDKYLCVLEYCALSIDFCIFNYIVIY